MSDSDASSDDGIGEQTIEQKPDVPVDRKGVPRHMRIRYWHSWEEMLLIELWRKHFEEITCLDKNLPIFRTISIGMKDSGFHINGQDVRRKIKTLKNKYVAERRRLNENANKDAKSDWRLYPLIHSLMTSSQKPVDPLHEEKALKKILSRIETDPLYHILLGQIPVLSTLEKIDAGEVVHIPIAKQFEGSFPAENKKVAECIAYSYENKYKRSFTQRTQRPSELAAAHAKMIAADSRAASLIPNPVLPSSAPASCSNAVHLNRKSGPLKRFATADSIKQLRMENIKLVEECVIATKRLKMEEQQLKAYEKIVQQIQSQYDNLFKRLMIAS